MTAMEPAFCQTADEIRNTSIDLLNQHLAAALILQDRMLQSPRHIRGPDFIMVDDLCDRVARLMEGCTMVIATRVADLGGALQWPVRLGWYPSAEPLEAELAIVTPLDEFAQSVLDAAAIAEAYGDAATVDVLAGVWRDVDRHLWMSVKATHTHGLAS